MLLFLSKMTAFWLVAWLLYRCLLSKETFHHWNRFYLLFAIGLGLVLPLIEVASPIATIPTFLLPELVIVGTAIEPQIVITAVQKNTNWSWQTYIGIGYAIGLLWSSWRFIRELYLLRKLKQEGLVQICPTYTWVAHPSVTSPFSFFGYLFWKEDPAMHPYILNHELAHIQQVHSLDKLLLRLLSVLFWWHPMVYLFQKELDQVHEYLADKAAIALGNKHQYGQLLLTQASTSQISITKFQIPISNTFIKSPIKNRIIMLLQPISPLKNSWKYFFVLPLLAIVFFACQPETVESPVKNVATIQGEQIDTKNKNTTPNSKNQEIIGDNYITDTIINFDVETYEETVHLVKTPIYKEVDQMPVFGDCSDLSGEALKNCSQNALLSYIYSQVKYPKEAAANDIEGTVVTKFVIRENGYIENLKIERNVSSDIDAEVLRVMKKMQSSSKALWKPGIKDGEAVNVELVLPIKFKLE